MEDYFKPLSFSSPLTLFPSIAVEVEDWSDIPEQLSLIVHSGDRTGEIIYVLLLPAVSSDRAFLLYVGLDPRVDAP